MKSKWIFLPVMLLAIAGLVMLGCDNGTSNKGGGGDIDWSVAAVNTAGTTTAIKITFNSAVTGLTAAQVTIGGGVATKTGTISNSTDNKEWTLPVTVTGAGTATVSISKTGIKTGTKNVSIVMASGGTTWSIARGDGANGTADTTYLVVTFASAVSALPATAIEISPAEAATLDSAKAPAKDTTTTDGTVWNVYIKVLKAEQIEVEIIADGINPGPHAITVYKEGEVADNSFTAEANGKANWETSTEITLTFDDDVTGLVQNDVTITAGTGAATLTGVSGSAKVWKLAITTTQAGTVTIKITKEGIAANEEPATVHMIRNDGLGEGDRIELGTLTIDGNGHKGYTSGTTGANTATVAQFRSASYIVLETTTNPTFTFQVVWQGDYPAATDWNQFEKGANATNENVTYDSDLGLLKIKLDAVLANYDNYLLCTDGPVKILFAAYGGTMTVTNAYLFIPQGVVKEVATVTFDANNAESENEDASDDPATIRLVSGTAMGAKYPATPFYDWTHVFAGWFDADDNEYDADEVVNGDLDLIAKWEDGTVPSVTITFDKNSTDATDGDVTTLTIAKDTAMAHKYPSGDGLPTRDGYAVAGWFSEATGGTQYTATTPVDADITLYAHWKDAWFEGRAKVSVIKEGTFVNNGKVVLDIDDFVDKGAKYFVIEVGDNSENFVGGLQFVIQVSDGREWNQNDFTNTGDLGTADGGFFVIDLTKCKGYDKMATSDPTKTGDNEFILQLYAGNIVTYFGNMWLTDIDLNIPGTAKAVTGADPNFAVWVANKTTDIWTPAP